MSFDETAWWGDCANTFHEEEKQLVYASRMGLLAPSQSAHPPTFDLMGRSVIDVGGGPVSLLLKSVNFSRAVVWDPGTYPAWVEQRYEAHGVEYVRARGEELNEEDIFDEAWCYNVLQHVDEPELVVENMLQVARYVRLFEWIGIEPYPGHPHKLEPELLNLWLGSLGFSAEVNENGAVGQAYYGVFAGERP